MSPSRPCGLLGGVLLAGASSLAGCVGGGAAGVPVVAPGLVLLDSVGPAPATVAPAGLDGEPPVRTVAFLRDDGSADAPAPTPPLIAPAPAAEPGGADDPTVVGDGPVPAADEPPAPVTLAELEAAALAHNPTLAGTAAAVRKAEGLYTQVGLYPNPTFGYASADQGEADTVGQQGVFATQTFVTADKLALSRAVERWEVEGLRWRLEAQRRRVLNGVRRQFYVALGAQRRLELAGELVEIAEDGLATAEQLFDAEQVARPDVLQVAIQLGEVRITRRDAELDFEAAVRRLTALAGVPERRIERLAGALEGACTRHDFEEVFAELRATTPELHVARARVRRARAAVCRQRAQPVPNVEAQATLTHAFASDETLAGLQFGLPLPVFNDNRGNIAAAVADLHRATADLARIELSLRSRLADALRDYRRATNRVDRYADDVLPAARENLELTEEGYRQGEFDIVRVFTARRSFFEANLARVESLADARAAEVAVDGLLLFDALDDIPDAGGDNLQGVGLRDQAFGGQ